MLDEPGDIGSPPHHRPPEIDQVGLGQRPGCFGVSPDGRQHPSDVQAPPVSAELGAARLDGVVDRLLVAQFEAASARSVEVHVAEHATDVEEHKTDGHSGRLHGVMRLNQLFSAVAVVCVAFATLAACGDINVNEADTGSGAEVDTGTADSGSQS